MSDKNLPAEILDLVESHVKAFNTQDHARLCSLFSENGVIIDGIAPFFWPNPNGPRNWTADADQWRANLGVTEETFAYEMGFWTLEGSAAYAVVNGTLTIKTKDQTIVRTGLLAYTFAQRDGRWWIESQAWGRTS